MRFMIKNDWEAFAAKNRKGASFAVLAILIAALMVTFSENAFLTNSGFFALLSIGVSAMVMRIAKARREAKLKAGIEWVPGPLRMR